jgi:hypothetical protein
VSRIARWGPFAGLGTVALLVVGVAAGAFGGPAPNEGSGQEWLDYFRDDETKIYVGSTIFLLGIVLFLCFLGSLRIALRAAEGTSGYWSPVAFGAGIAAATLLALIVVPGLGGALSTDALEPAAAQSLGLLTFVFFIAAQLFTAVLLAATAFAALTTRVLPPWLAWASLAVAIVLVTPIGFLGILIGLPLWVLAVSLLLWQLGRRAAVSA